MMRSRQAGEDDGFSLVETLVGMIVLAVIVVVSIQGIGRAFATLGTARDVDVVTGIAQAQIETIRSLDFADVGTTTGTPSGLIAETSTVEVQGVSVEVVVTVEWVGSASGLDIVPGGGDGVPGFFDPGLDYKLVTITATAEGGSTAQFETIVSPPNVTAAEDSANLLIEFVPNQPVGAALPTDFPTVYLLHDLGLYVGGFNDPTPLFADITPDAVHNIRLGAALDDSVTAAGDWAMIDPNATATVGVAQTLTIPIEIYRPITLEIEGLAASGAPLTEATLIVENDATAEQLVLTEADMAEPGTWRVTEMSGTRLRWGSYSYTLSAPGHETSTEAVTDAPSAYPSDLTERTTIQLVETAQTSSLTVTVTDAAGVALAGAQVSIDDGEATQALTSDAIGAVAFELVHGKLYDLEVTSPYGHASVTETAVDPTSPTYTGTIAAALGTPANTALFTIRHDSSAEFGGVFQYQPKTSNPDDWQVATPNVAGEVSVVVTEHTEDIYSRWEARVYCPADASAGAIKRRRFSPLSDKSVSFPEVCGAF